MENSNVLAFKKRAPFLHVFMILFLITGIRVDTALGMTSTHYRIDSQVIGGGGGDAGSAHYDVYDTLGQCTAGSETTSTNYRAYGGFWYAFLNAVNPLWTGALDIGDGWLWLDWFGYFNVHNDPWIYHNEHGFLYPFGTSTDSIVFWDNDMNAFWWTSDTQYPYVYRFSDGEWLWYLEGSSGPRLFVRLSDGMWEEW